MATQKPLRILCLREHHSSMITSVHQLLVDKIGEMGLNYFFDIEKNAIYGRNDPDRAKCSTIRFAGLATHPDSIRSSEGVDIFWLEECHDVTFESLRLLLPTVRGSIASGRPMDAEIWFTFNPRFRTDPVYQTYIVEKKDPNALIIQLNYTDNPWIANTGLLPVIEALKESDEEEWLHVWMGATLSVTEGAVLAKEIKRAEAENRFCKVRYDPSVPVECYWDIGFSDSTVSILIQRIPGGEIHILDCITNKQEPIGWYLDEISRREHEYHFRVKRHWMPHDAKARSLGSGLSCEEIIRNAGNVVQIVNKSSIEDGINAVRTIFANLWFDEVKCAELISNLRLYRFDIKKKTVDGVQRLNDSPVHDHSSHFFDCVKYLALALKPINTGFAPPKVPKMNFQFGNNNSWISNL